MTGNRKPHSLGGLAEALQKAGLATKEQAEQVAAEKKARERGEDLASSGVSGLAREGHGGYRARIDSVNEWFAELLGRTPDLAARRPGERTQAVVIEGPPATPAEIRAAELALGFSLPPSFAAFLLELGSVSFLNPWEDATTPVGQLAVASASLQADVALTAERFLQAIQQAGIRADPNAPGKLLHLCQEDGGEAVFALCSPGEAPVFKRYHDEPDALYDASPDFRQWFDERLDRLQDALEEERIRRPSR